MVNKIYLNSRFALRSDTLDNWQSKNPVLEDGEPSVVSNGSETEWLKIGDGVTDWNNLPYKLGPMGPQGVQGNKGEKGDKGDKGSDGLTPEADQTYNPESPNAQSGIAVAEALGYEVIGDITITETSDVIFRDNVNKYTEFLLLFQGYIATAGALKISTCVNYGSGIYMVNNLTIVASAKPDTVYTWWCDTKSIGVSQNRYMYLSKFPEQQAVDKAKVCQSVLFRNQKTQLNYGVRGNYAAGSRFILLGRSKV